MKKWLLANLALVLAGGCSGVGWEAIWSGPSPDGSRFAAVYRQNLAAFDSFQYRITIHKVDEKVGREPDAARTAWRSSGCRPVYLFWTSNSEIEVHVDPRERRCGSDIEKASVVGVEVITKPMKGWSKADVLSP